MAGYIFAFEGHGQFDPDGRVEVKDAEAHNKELERKEIEWLKSGPERVFLYVHMPAVTWHIKTEGYYSGHIEQNTFTSKADAEKAIVERVADGRLRKVDSRGWLIQYKAFWRQEHAGTRITTFLGTSVAEHVGIGQRVQVGFGFNSYRRSISCRIFGTLYHGWYMESSGDYCRLKKAKNQKG